MTHAHRLSRQQTAAALIAEGACLLPLLLSALLGLWQLSQPPLYTPFLPSTWVPFVVLTVSAAIYGIIRAPLRLWRVATYRRLCQAPTRKLHAVRLLFAAVGWRWHLWWRRLWGVMMASVPPALIWSVGMRTDTTVSLLCLILGGIFLVIGIVAVGIWQCRYALAPLLILDGVAPETAMALSVHHMRRHIGAYINFLGAELPQLLLCLGVIPCIWVLPRFHYRRMQQLATWMQPSK